MKIKKFIIILIVTILLALIAFNVGRMMARKVFEEEEEEETSVTENIVEPEIVTEDVEETDMTDVVEE